MTHCREPSGDLPDYGSCVYIVYTLPIPKYTVYTFALLLLFVNTTICLAFISHTHFYNCLKPTNAGRTFLSPNLVKFGYVLNKRKIKTLYCRGLVSCTSIYVLIREICGEIHQLFFRAGQTRTFSRLRVPDAKAF